MGRPEGRLALQQRRLSLGEAPPLRAVLYAWRKTRFEAAEMQAPNEH
jgi:hypothetical protein